MKKILIKTKMGSLTILALSLALVGGGRLYAGGNANSSSDGSHGWWDSLTTNPGQGDNRDDAHGGKTDRTGDGNSGQGDDLHKNLSHPEKCGERPGGPGGCCCAREQRPCACGQQHHSCGPSPEEQAKAREIAEAKRKEFIKRFDTNGDGKLDENERRAAQEVLLQERWQQFAKNHPDKAREIDRDGDGRLSREEKEAWEREQRKERDQWKAKHGAEECRRPPPPPACCCKEGPPPAYKYPSNPREYPSDSHMNRSGGGDNTNPGGQGNANGFDNPGNNRGASASSNTHSNRSGGGDGTNPGGHGNSSGFDNPGNN